MSEILAQFKALKLYGMAGCYADLQQQMTPDTTADFESSDKILQQLLQAEATERNIRSIRYQTQAARFPVQRAYSRRRLPPIPREGCHQFHGKIATDSTRRLPLIPVMVATLNLASEVDAG